MKRTSSILSKDNLIKTVEIARQDVDKLEKRFVHHTMEDERLLLAKNFSESNDKYDCGELTGTTRTILVSLVKKSLRRFPKGISIR